MNKLMVTLTTATQSSVFDELFAEWSNKMDLSPLQYCQNSPVNPGCIPVVIKELNQWIVWKAFSEKPDGRFDKVPICPNSGSKTNHMDKSKHLSFEAALNAHQAGCGDGIGISLTGKPLRSTTSQQSLYLIGVDLDKVINCLDKSLAAKSICNAVNSYTEISPSGTGIRIFALSAQPVGKGQSPFGEMYYAGRFLTVTGHGLKCDVKEATSQLLALEKSWWPDEVLSKSRSHTASKVKPVFPNTPRNRATLYMWLNNLTADCEYESYRDVVWAILSTGWPDAEKIAYSWCISAPQRFDPVNFGKVVQSYDTDHSKPITVRSLAYWSNRVMSDE